jgi:cell division protein FtsL
MEEIEWKKLFCNALSESNRKKVEKIAEKDKEVKPKHCYGITG